MNAYQLQFYQVNVKQTSEVKRVILLPVQSIERPPTSQDGGTTATELILAYAVLFTAVAKGINVILSRNDNR